MYPKKEKQLIGKRLLATLDIEPAIDKNYFIAKESLDTGFNNKTIEEIVQNMYLLGMIKLEKGQIMKADEQART